MPEHGHGRAYLQARFTHLIRRGLEDVSDGDDMPAKSAHKQQQCVGSQQAAHAVWDGCQNNHLVSPRCCPFDPLALKSLHTCSPGRSAAPSARTYAPPCCVRSLQRRWVGGKVIPTPKVIPL